jgi:selenocysteine-specific elongation factor
VLAGTLVSVGAAVVVDVVVELLPWAARPMRDRARLLAHIGTAQVACVVALADRARLAPGERAFGQLRLAEPTAAIAGLRFLLRGELPKGQDAVPAGKLTKAARAHASTLGGGRVLAVGSRKRRRRESDAVALQALAGDDPQLQADRLLLESGYPGASPQRLAARGAFTVKSAEKTLERLAQSGQAVLYDREARLYVHKDVLLALDAKVLARLREHAGRDSIDPSIAREELRQRAGAPPQKLFAKALTALAERGELRADAERVHPPGAKTKLSGADADAQEKLASVLDQAELAPPRADELPGLIGQSPDRTKALLKALAGAGRASKVSEELWFGTGALLDLRRRVLAHLAQHGSIDAQSFKELTGLTRKFAIPLLEYFDREKLTLRIGDKRVLRKGER